LTPAQPTESTPASQVHQVDGHAVLALSGDWIAQSGRIPEFPADGLATIAAGATIGIDIQARGRWDSGLIAFPWDTGRAALTAGIKFDTTALPPPPANYSACCPTGWPPPPQRRTRDFVPSTNWEATRPAC
jgi:phospholipid/cholesterol/gamma-HCH transport system permease protein